MRERKKPSQSWVQRSKYEIENEDRLLAERQEQLKEIRKRKQRRNSMKRGHKITIGIIVYLIFLYTLCFAGNAIMYGYTWLNAWEALKTLGISLGISLGITAIIFIICFLSHKWLEE